MKYLLAMFGLSVLSMPAAIAADAWDQLLACRRIPESTARLECFDRGADAASAAQQPAPAASVPKPTSVESSIAQISAPVAGRVTFTLENGQAWRQMDAENPRSAKVGDRVVVSKALLGAYWLKIDGGHAWRVTLIR